MKHTITVLQDDIDRGKRVDPLGCPIARAARRDLIDHYVHVGRMAMSIGSDEDSLPMSVTLPAQAQNFVRDFDDERSVEPFKFEIEIG